MWAVSDGTWGFPRGALIRYREWYGCTGEPNEGLRLDAGPVADGIRRVIGDDQLAYIAADPSIFKKDGGPSIAETFASRGVLCRRADNNRKGGWDRVRQHLNGWLGPEKSRPEGVFEPLLYLFDTCPDTIRTLESVPADSDDPDDVDTESEDHAVDDLRYGVMSRPWIIDSLPPIQVQPALTMNALWEANERFQPMTRV